jgi:hypothetical protein
MPCGCGPNEPGVTDSAASSAERLELACGRFLDGETSGYNPLLIGCHLIQPRTSSTRPWSQVGIAEPLSSECCLLAAARLGQPNKAAFSPLRRWEVGKPLRRAPKGDSIDGQSQWRRGRDSNPREAFDLYALSRGAPSTTRPPLRHRLDKEFRPHNQHAVGVSPAEARATRLNACRRRLPLRRKPGARKRRSLAAWLTSR